MIRGGELCKACGAICNQGERDTITLIECPSCNGSGENCRCNNGTFELTCCPRKYIGEPMARAITLAGMCGGGDWPAEGGLLDQSAWFVSLRQLLESERTKIENERYERLARK